MGNKSYGKKPMSRKAYATDVMKKKNKGKKKK
jgi:hypothetical protein